jgi:hypothetical protein
VVGEIFVVCMQKRKEVVLVSRSLCFYDPANGLLYMSIFLPSWHFSHFPKIEFRWQNHELFSNKNLSLLGLISKSVLIWCWHLFFVHERLGSQHILLGLILLMSLRQINVSKMRLATTTGGQFRWCDDKTMKKKGERKRGNYSHILNRNKNHWDTFHELCLGVWYW